MQERKDKNDKEMSQIVKDMRSSVISCFQRLRQVHFQSTGWVPIQRS